MTSSVATRHWLVLRLLGLCLAFLSFSGVKGCDEDYVITPGAVEEEESSSSSDSSSDASTDDSADDSSDDSSDTSTSALSAPANEFIDSDSDGLSDEEESAMGTDPLNIDSDGNGVLDTEILLVE